MADSVTDAERCGVWLDPIMAAKADELRGVTNQNPAGNKSRAAIILETCAAAWGIIGYTPRGKGKPKPPLKTAAKKATKKPSRPKKS